jgi:signal transduction histidine kinase
LTNSLLDISHLEAGQPIGDRTPAPIANLTNDAIEIVIPVAKNKQLEITSTVSPKLPLVLVDADMIRRVLTNLLENAIKFTPPKGKIEVGAVQEANWLNVWVQDTGPGIPVAEQERIFEKFARLNNDDYSKGFGLGLA